MRKIRNKTETLRELYKFLKSNVAMSTWWPAESRFEIFAGVVLTQNTSWRNVEKSIANLKEMSLLEAENLIACPDELIQERIRPSGFMRAKVSCLKALGRAFLHCDDEYRMLNYQELRERLLAIKGIGEESADTLCLYAYDKSCFIYDKYAIRLLEICGLLEEKELKYKQAKRIFDEFYFAADFSLEEAKALHGLIVNSNQWSQGRDPAVCLSCLTRDNLSCGTSNSYSDFETLLFNLNESSEIEDSKAKRDLAKYLLDYV